MQRFLRVIVAFVFSVTLVSHNFVFAGYSPVLSAPLKLDKIENIVYGSVQEGSLIQRMDVLEEQIYGISTSDPVLDRVSRMFDYLVGIPNGSEASFVTKLNVVEWRLKENMTSGPALHRVEEAETILFGTPSAGALAVRMENLLKMTAYADGVIPVQTVILPKDSLLKIEFMEEFGSRNNKKGDEVKFRTVDNLYVNDVLVLPRGASGVGKIKKIRRPSVFGRDAKLDIEFTYVYAIDGTRVPIYVGELAEQEAKSIAGSVGVSVAGMILLGPVGVLGGAFIKGKQVIIPAGTKTVVQTSEDVDVQGAIYQG